MKFVATLEHQRKSGKEWKPTATREYMVKFPNYQSPDNNELLVAMKKKLEKEMMKERFVVSKYHLYADDALTESEKLQLDINGSIINPPTEIKL